MIVDYIFFFYHICKNVEKAVRITHFSKHPFLVETVDEEDGGLCEGHEEVTERQVHNEVIWQAPQLLVTVFTHTRRGWSEGSLFIYFFW